MKSSPANILIIVGGCLVAAPLAFLYMSYRLTTQMLSEAMAHGFEAQHAHIDPFPPGYYMPSCLILGALCICVGALLSWHAYSIETSDLDLN
jgi:hypothetical protein